MVFLLIPGGQFAIWVVLFPIGFSMFSCFSFPATYTHYHLYNVSICCATFRVCVLRTVRMIDINFTLMKCPVELPRIFVIYCHLFCCVQASKPIYLLVAAS